MNHPALARVKKAEDFPPPTFTDPAAVDRYNRAMGSLSPAFSGAPLAAPPSSFANQIDAGTINSSGRGAADHAIQKPVGELNSSLESGSLSSGATPFRVLGNADTLSPTSGTGVNAKLVNDTPPAAVPVARPSTRDERTV